MGKKTKYTPKYARVKAPVRVKKPWLAVMLLVAILGLGPCVYQYSACG